MVDANITELRSGGVSDPTNALRQRGHRKRKAALTVTAPAKVRKNGEPKKLSDIKADVTVDRPRGHAVDVVACIGVGVAVGPSR